MKLIKIVGYIALLLTLGYVNSRSQTTQCGPCSGSIPCNVSSSDTVFDVHMADGSVLQNYRSIVRDFIPGFQGQMQAVRLYAWRNGHCADTIVPVTEISSISMGGLGPMNSPLMLPVYPTQEYYRVTANTIPANFIEITPFLGYGGKDTSGRNVGFKSFYEGLEILVAPFGTLLGEKMALALGGEALLEGGRLRIPAMGQLRYTFLGSEKIVDSTKYFPSNCALGCSGNAKAAPSDTSFKEILSSGRKDSSAYIIHDRTVARSTFRPFIYAEGSYIFNGNFTGAGANPSINSGDYGQYFFGAGIGTPFARIFTASLGYRYMRLNLRTPCPTCVDQFILNTNASNSLTLKIGIRL